jgi:DNA-binding NarL/FixJ family response regulator
VLEAGDLASGEALVDAHPELHLALVDLGLPDGSGVDLVRHIAVTRPSALVVVITIYDDDAHVFPALAAGAHGYLLKDAPPERWLLDLQKLEAGMPPLSPSIARRILASFRSRPPEGDEPHEVTLTKRETEVLGYIGRGLRVAEVARMLGLTENTVARYEKVNSRKHEVSSRAEAALEASRRGLT